MRPHPNLFKHFDRFSWLAVAAIAVVSLLGLLGRFNWALDLLSHFRVQYLQVALLLAGACLWVRRNTCALALVVLAAFNYGFIFPLYMGKPDTPPADKPIRALLMNINASNGNAPAVLSYISDVNPDLIVLEEVTPDWAFELSKLAERYPYHIMEPRTDCFGIMLLSKYPLKNDTIRPIGDVGLPSVISDVYLPHGEITVIGTHPLPPTSVTYAKGRNNQLTRLPALIREQRHPVLLIGDLNVSPFSYWFRRLLSDSALKNSMKGFGFQPSWPAQTPWLRIPLDHVLHAPEIKIHRRFTGPDVGSDHLPVVVDFSIQ
jgi:endonuclease/exonuclease/phosphatase (EEP) superfamily protein YafD